MRGVQPVTALARVSISSFYIVRKTLWHTRSAPGAHSIVRTSGEHAISYVFPHNSLILPRERESERERETGETAIHTRQARRVFCLIKHAIVFEVALKKQQWRQRAEQQHSCRSINNSERRREHGSVSGKHADTCGGWGGCLVCPVAVGEGGGSSGTRGTEVDGPVSRRWRSRLVCVAFRACVCLEMGSFARGVPFAVRGGGCLHSFLGES